MDKSVNIHVCLLCKDDCSSFFGNSSLHNFRIFFKNLDSILLSIFGSWDFFSVMAGFSLGMGDTRDKIGRVPAEFHIPDLVILNGLK